jgi:hypothetical protein
MNSGDDIDSASFFETNSWLATHNARDYSRIYASTRPKDPFIQFASASPNLTTFNGINLDQNAVCIQICFSSFSAGDSHQRKKSGKNWVSQ